MVGAYLSIMATRARPTSARKLRRARPHTRPGHGREPATRHTLVEAVWLEARAASPTVLRHRAYRGEEALAFLGDPHWTELVEQQARPNPTLLGGWQRALALQRRGEPLVLAVTAGDTLVAGGAFAIQRALGGRITYATWLGSSFQSFSPDALATGPDAADALVDGLLDEVDLVKLMAVGEGVLVSALRRRAPWGAIGRGRNGTYFSQLPPPTRNRLLRDAARDERRAARAGVEVEVRVATEPCDVAATRTALSPASRTVGGARGRERELRERQGDPRRSPRRRGRTCRQGLRQAH